MSRLRANASMLDSPMQSAATIFPALAQPLRVGNRTMRNRIVQAPLSACYQDESGYVTERTIAHYARRARGGVGMVITENFAVDEAGHQLPRHGLVAEESHLPGLTELASAIRAGGALAVLQLVHAGRYAGPWEQYEQRRRLAPSAVPFELTPGRFVTPDEMSLDEIGEVIAAFARATDLARRAGFDGVQIHGAQGFLLCQFQSPRMNRRTDGYGGDLDARCRLSVEVVDAVVAAAGGDLIVGYHLLSDEMMPGGWDLPQAAGLAPILQDRGVDFFSPVAATFESLRIRLAANPTVYPGLFNPQSAAAIAAVTSVPLFANGGLGDPMRAEHVVASGAADAIMQGRPLLADPEWAEKTLSGRAHEIVRCACSPPTCLGSHRTGVVCHSWTGT